MGLCSMIKRLLAASLAALALAACADPIESGYVMRKQYDDPDHWTEQVEDTAYTCQYEYGYQADGKYGFGNVCKERTVGYHTEARYDGPHWKLRIKDDKDPDRKQWVEVSQDEYNNYDIGTHWPDAR